jgi:hypothetical protein
MVLSSECGGPSYVTKKRTIVSVWSLIGPHRAELHRAPSYDRGSDSQGDLQIRGIRRSISTDRNSMALPDRTGDRDAC